MRLLLLLIVIVFFLCNDVYCGIFTPSNDKTKKLLKDDNDYGVDKTFPIHHYLDKGTQYDKRYRDSIAGCYKKYSQRECDANEQARIEMNLNQPSHQYNYSEIGFKKLRVPEIAWEAIKKFYETNKNAEVPEKWPRGNTYTNSWDVPTYMISFENKNLRGGIDTKQHIWNTLRPIIEDWTGHKLTETSLYGIRVYKRGAVLATHVDRLPLVSSCIIQVAQDVDEPWPVEVYDHHGKAHNVTMVPGDMVLYESHTVLHGRPFPLNGSNYANIFVHYIPVDHDEMNEKTFNKKMPKTSQGFIGEVEKHIGGHEQSNHGDHEIKKHLDNFDKKLQNAIIEEEEEEEQDDDEEEGDNRPSGQSALHVAAADGNLEEVEKILGNHSTDILNSKDENDWQPIHEAVRGGHTEVVKYLVSMGADISARTNTGGSVLWWAKRLLESDHPIIEFLKEVGAPEIAGTSLEE